MYAQLPNSLQKKGTQSQSVLALRIRHSVIHPLYEQLVPESRVISVGKMQWRCFTLSCLTSAVVYVCLGLNSILSMAFDQMCCGARSLLGNSSALCIYTSNQTTMYQYGVENVYPRTMYYGERNYLILHIAICIKQIIL